MSEIGSNRARLITEYIEPRDGLGPAEARVKGTGIPIWALIAKYRLTSRAHWSRRPSPLATRFEQQPRAASWLPMTRLVG